MIVLSFVLSFSKQDSDERGNVDHIWQARARSDPLEVIDLVGLRVVYSSAPSLLRVLTMGRSKVKLFNFVIISFD